MPYLKDFLFFNTGNECPETFHLYAALCLGSSVLQRKVYLDWGFQRVYPNLYVCLVGTQGSRKGVGKDTARDIHVEFFPDIMLGPSVSSPQAICKELASEGCTMAFKDEKGAICEVHSMTFFISELKHFLGINQIGMIDFLTDAYDSKYIETNYLARGKELIPNPYLTLLACETPEWILTRLKTEVISGGFARRLILVYEKALRERIALPFVTPAMVEARGRVVEALKKAREFIGPIIWTDAARKYYEEWYNRMKPPQERMMEGYYSSKHTQMLKIATILTVVEFGTLTLDVPAIELSIAILDRIEPGMIELFSSAGRNELAQPTERLLSYIRAKGGKVSEKECLMAAHRDMTPYEATGVIQHLVKTDQLFLGNETLPSGLVRRVIMTSRPTDPPKNPEPSA